VCNLTNLKLLNFSLLLLAISNITHAFHAAHVTTTEHRANSGSGNASVTTASEVSVASVRAARMVVLAKREAAEIAVADRAADQEFLSELSANPEVLRAARIKVEGFSMAVATATIAANAETRRAYDSASTEQERFYFRQLDRVRAELAAIKIQLGSEKARAAAAERELAIELRARIPASASTSGTLVLGKPPLAPGTPVRSRTGSGSSPFRDRTGSDGAASGAAK
jgi:uncharacterized membrane protein